MAEKKEVLEYLRNRQKAAEIESKINGVNLWVLLGAIALICWQFLSALGAEMKFDAEVAWRILVCAQCLYFINYSISGNDRNRDEVRFHRFGGLETDAAFNRVILGALLSMPPVASFFWAGWSYGGIILSVLGVLSLSVGLETFFRILRKPGASLGKFPEPHIGPSSESWLRTNLVMLFIICLAFSEQIFLIRAKLPAVSLEFAKALILLVALYLLVLAALERQRTNSGIDWTYELETELVIGSISPEVALRRIEHRALGRRLQDVMDGFFDELDSDFVELDAALVACSDLVDEAKKIPHEYAAERSSRTIEAGRIPGNLIEKINSDSSEFSRYLEKLKAKNKAEAQGRSEVGTLLQNLALRHEEYKERSKSARLKLDLLLSQIKGAANPLT